jgi:hypothetical protein
MVGENGQLCLLAAHLDRSDIDLIVHHQQRGAPGINVRKLGHGFLLADDEFSYDMLAAFSQSLA